MTINPHSGQERYGDLGENGQDGDEDESDGAQVVACHHGGDQGNHQDSLHPSLKATILLDHLQQDAGDDHLNERAVAEADEDGEEFEEKTCPSGPA